MNAFVRHSFVFVVIVLSAHIVPGRVHAGDQALDPTFGGDGRVTTDFFGGREAGRDVAVQRDAKIIAAGYAVNPVTGRADFALARYRPDGRLDRTFGGDGKVTTDFLDDDFLGAIAIQPDGRIVAAGAYSSGGVANLALARYNPNGTLDPTFGTDGKVMTSALATATSVALQADGKILVADAGRNSSSVARFNADGSPDVTFGGGGVDTGFDVYDLAVQADGRVLAAGADIVIIGTDPEGDLLGRLVVAVARFNADGSWDTTFGDGGKVLTELSEVASEAHAVLIQRDGKIVAVGRANSDFALARYNTDGSLDPTFGNGGTVTTTTGGGAVDGVLQRDGKIVVAGSAMGNATSNDFAVARYNVDGSLDTAFGTDGIIITDFGNNTSDIAVGVALAPGGRIVAAGWTNLGDFPTETFAIACYR